MKLRAMAPGKLVLLGEYAVLEGAPALVMAVGRHVIATVGPAAGVDCELCAPDIHGSTSYFCCDANGALRWQRPELARHFQLVETVIAGLGKRGLLPLHPWRAELDSSAFFRGDGSGRQKLGLGSSAALTVSLASALTAYAGHTDQISDRGVYLQSLLAMHREFQGGRGSGLDVAAALYGGELVFRRAGDGSEVLPVAWPVGLERIYVWSGRSASTRQFLQYLVAWRESFPRRYEHCMRAIGSAAEAGIEACRQGAADRLLQAVARTADGLRQLGSESRIPIFSAEHDALAAAVHAAGAVYKPCGAGGGDLGVAVAIGAAGTRRVVAAVRAAGFRVVELHADHQGLAVQKLGGAAAEVEAR